MFKKVKQNRVFQHVVEQVESALLEGRLKPGDMLPSELKLKDMFDTSRGTVREALRVLEQKGLIEIKTGAGGGAMVKPVSTDMVTDSLSFLLRFKKVTLKELVEFRVGMEGSIAAIAAAKAVPGDIQTLRTLLEQRGKVLDRKVFDWETFDELDRQIHLALVKISQNQVYRSVMETVHLNIVPFYDDFKPDDEALMAADFKNMSDIIDAVEKGDAMLARELMETHVRQFHQALIG